MPWIDLHLDRNEASDLLPLASQAVLDAHGWDLAYYIFLDEDHLDDAVGVLGHQAGAALDEAWEHVAIVTDCGKEAQRTDDSEAAARYDGCVYIIGSHYGKKAGPLQPARHWIARFDEDALTGHLVGFRAMSARGDDSYDCIVGSLDASDKGSLLLECYPAGTDPVSSHWRFSLAGVSGSGVAAATEIKHFPDQQRIEGISPAPDGHYAYVVEEDHRVHLRFLAVD